MTRHQSSPSGAWVKWPLLWLAGLYLRITLLVAAPLGSRLAEDLTLSVSGMGALTTLPVLLLSLACASRWLGRRGSMIGLVMLAFPASWRLAAIFSDRAV